MMLSKQIKSFEEDEDEGFEDNQLSTEEVIIQPKKIEENYQHLNSLIISQYKTKTRYNSSEKPILKLGSLDSRYKNQKLFESQVGRKNKIRNQQNCTLSEDEQQESDFMLKRKSRKPNRYLSIASMEQLLQSVVVKTKRVQIAQNLYLNNHSQQQERVIKQIIEKTPNSQLAYHEKSSNNTYSYFKRLLKSKCEPTFINSKYNMGLKQKLQKAKILFEIRHNRKQTKQQKNNCLEFKGDFQSANIDYALKISDQQYNVYLRIDTNTRGHQSWFYFKASNKFNEDKTFRINICNVRRKFKMIGIGQKIYIKSNDQEWKPLQTPIQVEPTGKKNYKMSFDIDFKSKQQKFISLIPPYTYSTLLKDVETFEKYPDIKVQTLTYSVTGLAVPLITISKGASRLHKNKNTNNRKLFLISARIHPSETCSSYIINGLINELVSNPQENYEQFLNNAIIKIVPMLNPDGVVFGNFRTSYLGDDLNRSFYHTDDTIFPQIVALKELGRSLQAEFGQNFVGFIDLHGHSCQTNSFVYGPQHDQNSDLYVECRVFPKILDKVSKYFKYQMSEFKLEDYKFNTARGFFFKKLKIPSYTIETSYALYHQKQKSKSDPKDMSVTEWKDLGTQIANALQCYIRYIDVTRSNIAQTIIRKAKQIKNTIELRKTYKGRDLYQSKSLDFMELKKQIIKQSKEQIKIKKDRSDSSESDGQSCQQDLTEKQRQFLVRKVKQVTLPSYLFPKVAKASLILPSVQPAITIMGYGQGEQKILTNIPRLANKFRQKKLVRPINLSHQYTQYLLKNIQGIGSLKPQIINFGYPNKSKYPEFFLKK